MGNRIKGVGEPTKLSPVGTEYLDTHSGLLWYQKQVPRGRMWTKIDTDYEDDSLSGGTGTQGDQGLQGDQGPQGDPGDQGPTGGFSLWYAFQYDNSDLGQPVDGFRNGYIGYSKGFPFGGFATTGTLWLSRYDINNNDFSGFYTALMETISTSPLGYLYVKIFSSNNQASIFKCLVSDIGNKSDGLQFDNFTILGGNFYTEGAGYISFLSLG